MSLTPEEIEQKQFLMALRGYDKDQVDGFLKDLAAEYRQLLDALEDVRNDRGDARAGTGTDPFEGLARQLESILKFATEQADQVRAAAAADVASQVEAARHEAMRAASLRAAAEQDATEARRELEDARGVKVRAENEAATILADARRHLDHINAENEAATQRLDQLREAEERHRSTTAERREAVHRELVERRHTAEREIEELRVAAEREISQRRAVAERELEQRRAVAEREMEQLRVAAEHEISQRRAVAEREIADLRVTAEREAAELRAAADWACQEAAKVLEAAEEERNTALGPHAQQAQGPRPAPMVQPSDRSGAGPRTEGNHDDPPRTTLGSWFFGDD